jgi:hypothetical protein
MDRVRITGNLHSSSGLLGGKPLQSLHELWWGHDRRRQIAQLGQINRRHPLDEGYVVDAMARQIEEIRNLPEVAG